MSCGVPRAQGQGPFQLCAVGLGPGPPPPGPGPRRVTRSPLQHLEQSLDALHLSSFGLMDTTLEEVFLKVSEEDQSLENSEAGEQSQSGPSVLHTHPHPGGLTLGPGGSLFPWLWGPRALGGNELPPVSAGLAGAEEPGQGGSRGTAGSPGQVGEHGD